MNAATDYVEAGLALVPLRPGTKKPLKDDWTLKENAVTTTAQAKKLNGGLGLAHAWSGTCAFDIDDFFATIDWFQEHGIDVATLLQHPAAVKIDSGRQNRAKLLYRLPDGVAPPLTIKHLMPSGATMFELRCADASGNSVHCVLPPSIHPDTGKPYKWVGDWHKIPVIPDELLAVWSGLIANHHRRAGDRPKAVSPEDLSDQTLIDLDSALASISSDSRETWIAVGHALKGLGEYGYQLWLAWSRKSSAYRPGDEERWDSFDPKHTDYRAIFSRAARDHDWVNPGYRWEEAEDTRDTRDNTRDDAVSVELIRGSDIEPKPIDWIWPGWLAAGKFHILGGAPGAAKTMIGLNIAAIISRDGVWPDGSRSTVGNVAIWSGEDDWADTLVPRLICAGADMTRIYFVGRVTGFDFKQRPFDPSKDMEPLKTSLSKFSDVRLLMVDSIVSAVAGDSHKNSETRRGLQPLVDLAILLRCALLGITHFSKNTQGREPLERLSGSLAFGALARVVMAAARHPKEEFDDSVLVSDWYFKGSFMRIKSNIGPDSGGFEYESEMGVLEPSGIVAMRVRWLGTITGSARDMLHDADDNIDAEETGASVAKWLRKLLIPGPMDQRDVMTRCNDDGISRRKVQRASAQLKIVRERSGRGKDHRCIWSLPKRVDPPP